MVYNHSHEQWRAMIGSFVAVQPLNIILVTSFATTDEIHNSITRSTFSFETTSVDTSQLCATSKESSSFGSSMDTRRIRVRSFLCSHQKLEFDFHGF